MKFILFILNFKNSNYITFGPKLAMDSIDEFNTIFLFSIYITFYYKTILIWQDYVRPKIMEIFMDLRDAMGGNISKI
jgi:hypothetical protein